MGLRLLVAVVGRRWRWLVIPVGLGILGAVLLAALTPPVYRAGAQVFFAPQYGGSATDLVQGGAYTQNQVASFAQLATTPAVLQPVIDELDLRTPVQQLAARVSASAPLSTVLIDISVQDPSAGRSAQIANGIAASLAARVEDLVPVMSNGRPSVRAAVVAPAAVPTSAVSPRLPVELALGLVAGLVAGALLVAAREVLDTRLVDVTDMELLTGMGAIGVLPRNRGRVTPSLLVDGWPAGPGGEAFRRLGAAVEAVHRAAAPPRAGGRVTLVTSPSGQEGRTTVAVNLAAALAQSGARVLLVDADVRGAAVASVLGLDGRPGLGDVLAGGLALADAVIPGGPAGADVLPAGTPPTNPVELVGPAGAARLLAQLRRDYDHVVVDAPPVLSVADAMVLSASADLTLLLVAAGRSRRGQLLEAARSLGQVGAPAVSLVVVGGAPGALEAKTPVGRESAPVLPAGDVGAGRADAAGMPPVPPRSSSAPAPGRSPVDAAAR